MVGAWTPYQRLDNQWRLWGLLLDAFLHGQKSSRKCYE